MKLVTGVCEKIEKYKQVEIDQLKSWLIDNLKSYKELEIKKRGFGLVCG